MSLSRPDTRSIIPTSGPTCKEKTEKGMIAQLWTTGHSTRNIDIFILLLEENGIKLLALACSFKERRLGQPSESK
jgi:hypothetical protein